MDKPRQQPDDVLNILTSPAGAFLLLLHPSDAADDPGMARDGAMSLSEEVDFRSKFDAMKHAVFLQEMSARAQTWLTLLADEVWFCMLLKDDVTAIVRRTHALQQQLALLQQESLSSGDLTFAVHKVVDVAPQAHKPVWVIDCCALLTQCMDFAAQQLEGDSHIVCDHLKRQLQWLEAGRLPTTPWTSVPMFNPFLLRGLMRRGLRHASATCPTHLAGAITSIAEYVELRWRSSRICRLWLAWDLPLEAKMEKSPVFTVALTHGQILLQASPRVAAERNGAAALLSYIRGVVELEHAAGLSHAQQHSLWLALLGECGLVAQPHGALLDATCEVIWRALDAHNFCCIDVADLSTAISDCVASTPAESTVLLCELFARRARLACYVAFNTMYVLPVRDDVKELPFGHGGLRTFARDDPFVEWLRTREPAGCRLIKSGCGEDLIGLCAQDTTMRAANLTLAVRDIVRPCEHGAPRPQRGSLFAVEAQTLPGDLASTQLNVVPFMEDFVTGALPQLWSEGVMFLVPLLDRGASHSWDQSFRSLHISGQDMCSALEMTAPQSIFTDVDREALRAEPTAAMAVIAFAANCSRVLVASDAKGNGIARSEVKWVNLGAHAPEAAGAPNMSADSAHSLWGLPTWSEMFIRPSVVPDLDPRAPTSANAGRLLLTCNVSSASQCLARQASQVTWSITTWAALDAATNAKLTGVLAWLLVKLLPVLRVKFCPCAPSTANDGHVDAVGTLLHAFERMCNIATGDGRRTLDPAVAAQVDACERVADAVLAMISNGLF